MSRQEDIVGLCIEASLDTGHFPENVTIKVPPEEFDEGDEVFTVKAFAVGPPSVGVFDGQPRDLLRRIRKASARVHRMTTQEIKCRGDIGVNRKMRSASRGAIWE